jgi:GPH family glycoside/pentoside/hexuronide:cation symporter
MIKMGENETEIKHSKLGMASYGFGSLARQFLDMAFTAYSFFYYESEIGLNVWLIMLAYILFALYNMFNDPLIGYLTNRPFKFTKKWGRRFPWLLIGGLPWGLTYILIFIPPNVDPVSGAWILFAWLLFTVCLFDTFHSLFFTNYLSLFPDKYRTVRERRTASGIYTPIGTLGVALGAILPPLFITFGVVSSYVSQGIWVFLIAFITMGIAIPSFREDRETIDSYLATYEERAERTSFFKSLWSALKQRPFLIYMLLYTLYQSTIVTLQNSLPFTIRYILEMPASATTLIFAGMLIGAVISIPIWTYLSHKTNNNKMIMVISGILLGMFTLPLLFLENYTLIIINMLLFGIALGGFWVMIFPVMSDVIDDAVVATGKREEGVYGGFSQFFSRLGIVSQAITFGIVHSLTGFVEGAATQSSLAVTGIHIHLGLVPAIFILVGSLIFWKWYKLSPEKIAENQLKIKELSL